MRYFWRLVVSLFFIFIFSGEGYCFDTMVDYENKTRDGGSWFSHMDNCFSSHKAIFQLSVGDFNNVSIPHYLSKNMSIEQSTTAGWSELATIGRAYLYINALLSFSAASVLALIAMGIEYIIMLDICTNAHIIAPHEYANLVLGYECEPKDPNRGTVKFVGGKDKKNSPLTAIDVPFFYHCDPMWDPDKGNGGGELEKTDENYREKLDNTYGYMGAASPYCTNDFGQFVGDSPKIANNKYGLPTDAKKLIGHALVSYTNIWERLFGHSGGWTDIFQFIFKGFRDQHPACTFQRGHALYDITGGDSANGFYRLIGYYRFNSSTGKVQLCVAAPYTLFPVNIGCTYVPPPVNLLDIPFLNVAEGTRCIYFGPGRTDLKSLGLSINKDSILTDSDGNKKSISNFLMSDMHITSTVVGCILDLLDKVFIDTRSGQNQPTFFQNIQKNLKKIVVATLILYVCLTGIKVMSSAGSLRRKDYIMFILKFALVIYFTLGDAWFAVDEKGNKVGIYYGIVDGAQQIANYFMEAHNMSDPLGHCRFQYYGDQLLSQRNIPAIGDIEATAGAKGIVKMTVWDLIDCRVINYLNMGTCNYTFAGLIAIWAITALILVSGIGFVLCIAMFVYSYMLLKIIFKFTHIFILSMFVITILVVVSPIMIVFVLFEFTKGIFDQWFKMLLGYVIYPGLHFAFIALMLATFDSIYFGGLKMDPGSPSIFEQCEKLGASDTPICAIANNLKKNDENIDDSIRDMCDMNIGHIVKSMYETTDLWILGTYTRMTGSIVEALFLTMLKLALMAFLFFMLMNSISSFFAYLTGVESMESMAKGDLSAGFAKAFGFAAKSPFKAMGKAFGKKSSGGSDGGGSGKMPRK